MVINGTGHRPFQFDKKTNKWISKLEFTNDNGVLIKGNSRELYDRLVDLASAWLRKHHEVDIVIQGGAMGWDLALGRAALLEKREMHFYVPFKGHGQDWKTFYKEEHNDLLASAHHVHAPDVPFSVKELLKRNEDMVNGADMVLALHDGSPGGTSSCLKYAESVKKPHENLWGMWERYRGRV